MTLHARHLLALAALAALTACSDPLKQVPRLSEVDLAEPASPVEAAIIASQQEREAPSLMARIFGGDKAPAPASAAEAPVTTADASPAPTTEPTSPPKAERPRGLAALFAPRAAAPAAAPVEATTQAAPERPVAKGGMLASLFGPRTQTDAPRAQAAAVRPPAPRLPRASTGPDARDVTPGEPVPFGQIARICDIPRKQMGRRIAKQSGMDLWDSFPQSTAPRPFYITGFSDRCPRVVTGTLAMVGAPRLHETHRYSSRARYSEVDTAYEQVKSSVCRVPRGKPCGSAMGRLERRIAMFTFYESFGSAGSATVLIDNKRVKAISRDR